MLKKMIETSTHYLVSHHVIEENDRDIYEYGFHAVYNNLVDVTSIIIISIMLNMIPQAIVYHIAFIPLRNTAGGYHSKTHIRCFITSTSILLVSLFAISNITAPSISIGLASLSVILLWIKTPIEHENNPMSLKKYRHMKTISRIVSVIFLCLIILMNPLIPHSYRWITMSLALGMVSHSALMVMAMIQSFKKNHHK